MSKALELAVEKCTPETALRHKQLLSQHFGSIKDKSVSDITESDIRKCLQAMLDKGITSKGFNNATSTLKKISDYCKYEHIDCLDLRNKIDEFRRVQTTGKKTFVKNYKPASVLAFSEVERIRKPTNAVFVGFLSDPDGN